MITRLPITTILFVTLNINRVIGLLEEIQIPADIKGCFERSYSKGDLSVQIGEKVAWRCIQGTLWVRARNSSGPDLPEVAIRWFTRLIHQTYSEAHQSRRIRRQATMRRQQQRGQAAQRPLQLRLRREYRMLSDAERNRFHQAMVLLKRDTSIPPNRFDALGRLHEMLGDRAHDGPNFLGWHRFFLIVAENALREKVPDVTIPYWDSTLDGALHDPRASIIWTASFMGNGNGAIRSGPFTGWMTPYGPLLRNFGDGGTTMNWTIIRDTFTRSHLADITAPSAEPAYNLEDHHGEPHLWVGGHMSPQALAGYDPIFFLHHSFIDLLWELFRRIQRRRGVDPTTDYPRTNTGPPGQGYHDPSGFGSLLNRHSLSDIFTTEIYTYQLPPTCTRERPSCGSPYLHCDLSGRSARCISASIFDIPPREVFNIDAIIASLNIRNKRSTRDGGLFINKYSNIEEFTKNVFEIDSSVSSGRSKRFVPNRKNVFNKVDRINTKLQNIYRRSLESAADVRCQPENVNDKYVNNFLIDGISDKSNWVFIPIEITVDHGHYVNIDSKNTSVQTIPASYPRCSGDTALPYRVFTETNGLNYRGFFKETTQIRKDVPIASEVTFVGVKKPTSVQSEFVLTAYDSCGRICRLFCRSKDGRGFQPCPGGLKISADFPKQYGDSADAANRMLWSRDQYDIPFMDSRQLFVKVVCDANVIWPW